MIKFANFILLCVCGHSLALDLELATEGSCIQNLTGLPLDPGMLNNTILYTPLISKYEMYRFAEDILHKKAEDISDHELKTICPTYRTSISGNGLTFDSVGSGGNHVTYVAGSEDPNIILFKINGHKEWDAKWYIRKIEKDYFIGVACWSTGQRSWSVNSQIPKVSEDMKKEIFSYLKSQGFEDTKYYHENNYDDCKNEIKKGYCINDCMNTM